MGRVGWARAWPVLLLSWAGVAAPACGDPHEDAPPPDDAGVIEPATGPDRALPAGTRGTVEVHGDFQRFFQQPYGAVVGGEVCVIGPREPLCTVSDAGGQYVIQGVPSFSLFELRFQAEGLVPSVRPIRTAAHDLALYGNAYTSEDLLGWFQVAGEAELDRSKGIVTFEATRGTAVWLRDVEGASASLRSLANPADVYPAYYVNAVQVPLGELTATTSAGWGFFVDVPAGEYALTVTHESLHCGPHPVLAWPAPERSNATLRVPVRAGGIVYATAYCR